MTLEEFERNYSSFLESFKAVTVISSLIVTVEVFMVCYSGILNEWVLIREYIYQATRL